MSITRKWPIDEAENFLRQQMGEDGDAAPKLHGKVDGVQSTANATNTTANTINGKIGTPVVSVSADIAAVQADADAIQSELANAAYGLEAIKDLVVVADAAIDAVDAKLGTPAGASVSADVAAVKAQTGAIETDTQDIQSKIGTPVNGTISLDVAEVMAAVSGLQNDTTFGAYVPEQLERPKVGDPFIEYQILVDHKDGSGNMEDFDAAPTVDLVNLAGTDRSGYLRNAAGTATQTMDNDGTGRYSLRIRILDSTVIENLMVTINALEATKVRIKRLPARVDESFSDHFNTTDRSTLNTAKSNTDQLLLDVAAVETHLDGIEAKVDLVKIDTAQTLLDVANVDADLLEAKTKTAGTFNRDTMSLEAIREMLDTLSGQSGIPIRAKKQSGAITAGNYIEETLGTAEKWVAKNAEIRTVIVRPTTTTSRRFRVRLYERTAQAGLDYLVADWDRCDSQDSTGGLAAELNAIFTNQAVAPTSEIYVRIDNTTDPAPGGSIFNIELRGLVLGEGDLA